MPSLTLNLRRGKGRALFTRGMTSKNHRTNLVSMDTKILLNQYLGVVPLKVFKWKQKMDQQARRRISIHIVVLSSDDHFHFRSCLHHMTKNWSWKKCVCVCGENG